MSGEISHCVLFQCISFTVPQWSRFHWDVFCGKCHPVQYVQTRKNKSKDAYVNLQNFVAGGGIRGQTPNKIIYSQGDWSILEANMLCKNDHLKFWPMENHSVSQFFWWASEICARLWPDKDQSFAILFADLFLIEPSKKARLRGDDVFFSRDSVNVVELPIFLCCRRWLKWCWRPR